MVTRRTPYTNAEFADAARQVHGSKYDYSQVEYKNNRTPVVIVCPFHGGFTQSPSNHLRGKKCPLCARKELSDILRKSPSEFIKQAIAVHGGKYEYSRVVYTQARSNVEIICPKHGSFWQTPDAHLSGKGCQKCGSEASGNTTRFSNEDFITKARKMHGEKFDYSKVQYKNAREPVEIICPRHGSFRQAPVTHNLSVHGCPKCGHEAANKDRLLTTKDFLKRARTVHGDKYDYSLVECQDSKSKVSIICQKHGSFKQTVGGHLSGRGCKKCGNELIASKQTIPQAEFIARAREAHSDKYDYSLVDYKSAKGKVKIICPVHGEFEQSAFAHFTKGCRKCADENLPGRYTLKVLKRDPELANKPAILYYLHFKSDQESFYKVGITLNTVKKRYSGYEQAGYTYTVLGEKKTTLVDAYLNEQQLLRSHAKQFSYRPKLWENRGGKGSSECFTKPIPDDVLSIFN